MTTPGGLTDEQMALLIDPDKEKEWIETFLHVPSEDEGLVKWTLTEQQRRIVDTTKRIRKLLVVKGRQTRCSTILLAKALRHSLTHYGQNYVIITQTDEMTQNFRTFLKDRLQELREVLGDEHAFSTDARDGGLDNTERLRIGRNKSTFHFASAEQKVGLRGIQTAHWVHASEVAHWPDAQARKIIGGLLPASPANGFFFAESTPNGAAGWFYEKCADAMPLVPVSLWTVAFFPWWLEEKYTLGTLDHVLRDAGIDPDKLRFDFRPSPQEETLMRRENLSVDRILWRRLKAHDLMSTGQYFAQEYPEDLLSCWLAAGVGFFHDDQYDHLDYYRQMTLEPRAKYSERPYTDPVTGVRSEVSFLGPNMQVWVEPLPGHKYVAFQDVSAGVAVDGDYSALAIMDVTSGVPQHVATVRVRTLAGRVGHMAAAACAWYNWAYLGIEANSYGLECIAKVQELHYPNLYYDVVNNPENPKLGWSTQTASRELMLNRFRQRVFDHQFSTHDRMAVLEMGAFTWRKVQGRSGNVIFRAEADKGNDDMVIAMAGACAIAPYAPSRVRLGRVDVVQGLASQPGDLSGVRINEHGIVVRDTESGILPWLR